MPMQGMSQAANMLSSGAPQAANALGSVGGQAMRGGGLLSRLLGGLGGASGSAGTAGAAGNSLMSGLSSAAGSGMNFTTMLTNAQKVLGLTHQVVPMIQQYGPLVRNAPAIWKIMMSNNSNDQNQATEEPSETETTPDEPKNTSIPIEDTNIEQEEAPKIDPTQTIVEEKKAKTVTANKPHSFKPKSVKGIPGPKLYI